MGTLSRSLSGRLILFIGAMVATICRFLMHPQLDYFQSPFHRGNGCYGLFSDDNPDTSSLSVPFSSGQWLLHTAIIL